MTWQETRSGGTRFRFNVATTSKGFYSWESTVETMLDSDPTDEVRKEVLKASVSLHDELEAMLRERYGHLQDKPMPASETIKGLEAMAEQKKPSLRDFKGAAPGLTGEAMAAKKEGK